jgi:hypothetical protein
MRTAASADHRRSAGPEQWGALSPDGDARGASMDGSSVIDLTTGSEIICT